MLKFFRKYQKWILGVGGTILMVLFLLPTTTTSLFQGGANTTVARMDGGKITLLDLQNASREIAVIEALQPGLMQGLGINPRQPEHWILLIHEAEKAGLVGGLGEGRAGLSAENRKLALERGIDEVILDRAVQKINALDRLFSTTNPGALYSSVEAVQFGHRLLDKVTIDTAIIQGSAIGAMMPPPDEARLVEHFEEYKNTAPSASPYGIGYRREPAVLIEWFSINRLALQTAFTPDPIEVNKHWRQNQTKFTGEFAAIRNQVEMDYKRTRIQQMMDRAASVIKTELFKSTNGLAADGPYKVLPDEWSTRMPLMQQLAAFAEEALRKEIPTLTQQVTTVSTGDNTWRTQNELAQLPAIGNSYILFGTTGGMMLPQYAFAVRELAGPSTLGLQEGLVYGPMLDASENSYYFRVIDTRPAGPPDSLAEVRERVILDVRLLDGLKKLESEAEVYKERAIANSIGFVAESAGVIPQFGIEITRQEARSTMGGPVDPRYNDPDFRSAIMDLADQLDPRAPAKESDPAERTLARVVPAAKGLVVAQIQSWRPMTQEVFRKSGVEIRRLSLEDSNLPQIRQAFTFDRLKARHNFVVVATDPEEAEQTEAADASTDAPAEPSSETPAPAESSTN